MILHPLYNTAWRIITPLGKRWLQNSGHAPLVDRFNPPLPQDHLKHAIWIHACSLGEVNTAAPLIHALQNRYPDAALLLTTSTQSGMERAQTLFPDITLTWCPFDAPGPVQRFYDQVQPKALYIIESEFWPNLYHQAQQRNIPLILVNGRISDKHYTNYQKWAAFYTPIFKSITLACMQSDLAAQRITALGTPQENVQNTGNIKFDGAKTEISPQDRARLQRALNLNPNDPLLLFGSTREGDEALASACWMTLREEHPTMKMVIAPRHFDRLEEILALFQEPPYQWSKQKTGTPLEDQRVIILDTMGELSNFYAIATAAVVGGSFYPGVGGHNPIEPTALGVPTLFGPYMENFLDPAQILTQANGALQVPCPEDLYEALSQLLADPAELRQLGTRGRKAVLDAQGALQRTLDAAAPFIQ